MASIEDVLNKLKAKARPDQLEGMARFGMTIEKRWGVSVAEIRKIAKELDKNHNLAIELWRTGIAEAKILASMIGEPEKMTEKQMEKWVKDFDSWDVCDQVCMNLFDKTPFVWEKVLDWSKRDEEFVKRTAFALIASLACHDKEAEDEKFIELFPVIRNGAIDQRNFVKKAVSWALRNIGKRNPNLNKKALIAAKDIRLIDTKPARWIASDVIRELESEGVQKRLRK